MDRGIDGTKERLVLSIAETAQILGVSDDLVYDMTERGELPCLHFGRRKLIPRRAINLLIEHALEHFDPGVVVGRLLVGAGERSMAETEVAMPSAPPPTQQESGGTRTRRGHRQAAPSTQTGQMGMFVERDQASPR